MEVVSAKTVNIRINEYNWRGSAMAKPLEVDQQWLERIVDQVSGISYGHVTITVHDGRIVQIDRT